jgi:hypothetical protein
MAQELGGDMKILAASALLLGAFYSQSAAAQGYPSSCTGSYRFTASCCKASYSANPEGKVSNSARIAALEQCSLNERAAERAAKKKK